MKTFLVAALAVITWACVGFAQEQPNLDNLTTMHAEGVGKGTQAGLASNYPLINGGSATVMGEMRGQPFGTAKFDVTFGWNSTSLAGPITSHTSGPIYPTFGGLCGFGSGTLIITTDDRSTITADILGSACSILGSPQVVNILFGCCSEVPENQQALIGPTGLNLNYHITGGAGRYADAKGGGHLDITITSSPVLLLMVNSIEVIDLPTTSAAYTHLDGNMVCEQCREEPNQPFRRLLRE